MSRAIRPVFTEAQTKAVRYALRTIGEEELDAPMHRARENALRQLDRADIESRRRRSRKR